MTNPYVDAGDGYTWYIVEKVKEPPESMKYHNLSRDNEYKKIADEDALGTPMALVPMKPEEKEFVASLPHIAKVYKGGYVTKAEFPRPNVTENFGLFRHQSTALWRHGLTGKDIKVGVLDTGISYARLPEYFSGRTEGRSFIEGESVDDLDGHGTFCAGQIGASGYQYGAAPDCLLLIGKVLSNDGYGSYSGIIEGLNWAVYSGARVVSMSLGGPGSPDNPLNRAVTLASQRGVVVVVASGNEQRGQSRHMADLSVPANGPDGVTVGAVTNDLALAGFSNIGSSVDIAAVGVDVRGLGIHQGEYVFMSGTSMATPHVAGVMAQMAEIIKDGDTLRKAVLSGARDTELTMFEEGNGILKGLRALRRYRRSQ